jgi:hypothetical protein
MRVKDATAWIMNEDNIGASETAIYRARCACDGAYNKIEPGIKLMERCDRMELLALSGQYREKVAKELS